jgi:hypothetical protein
MRILSPRSHHAPQHNGPRAVSGTERSKTHDSTNLPVNPTRRLNSAGTGRKMF